MTETPAPEKCPAVIAKYPGTRSASMRDCGRPVKDDGLCGIHLAAKLKKAANDAAYRAAEVESNARGEAASALAREAEEVTGTNRTTWAQASRNGYSGNVTLTADVLRALLDLARKAQQS